MISSQRTAIQPASSACCINKPGDQPCSLALAPPRIAECLSIKQSRPVGLTTLSGYLQAIWVAALFAFALWLMSVLKCEMATPAY